jgi:DNA polymerase III alpha subunit (gram-positive type)
LELIQDSIVVAHNARFEENFLAFELNEAGHELKLIPALDTLWLARETIELPNYKLDTVVNGFNERIVDAHTALGDVIAVSKILPEMLSRIGQLYFPVTHPLLPSASVPFKAKTR